MSEHFGVCSCCDCMLHGGNHNGCNECDESMCEECTRKNTDDEDVCATCHEHKEEAVI